MSLNNHKVAPNDFSRPFTIWNNFNYSIRDYILRNACTFNVVSHKGIFFLVNDNRYDKVIACMIKVDFYN